MAYPNDGKTKPCYLFDLDGTIADLSHRLPHIQKDPKDWDAFYAACGNDPPIPHIINLVHELAHHRAIVLVSGRSDRVRELTETWLKEHGVVYNALYMRPDGDIRDDFYVKKILLKHIIFDGWNPLMAFDDRDQVVKMWRGEGIPCAQVADGNF